MSMPNLVINKLSASPASAKSSLTFARLVLAMAICPNFKGSSKLAASGFAWRWGPVASEPRFLVNSAVRILRRDAGVGKMRSQMCLLVRIPELGTQLQDGRHLCLIGKGLPARNVPVHVTRHGQGLCVGLCRREDAMHFVRAHSPDLM